MPGSSVLMVCAFISCLQRTCGSQAQGMQEEEWNVSRSCAAATQVSPTLLAIVGACAKGFWLHSHCCNLCKLGLFDAVCTREHHSCSGPRLHSPCCKLWAF